MTSHSSNSDIEEWRIFLAGADPGRYLDDVGRLDSLQDEFDYIQDELKLRSAHREKFNLVIYPSLDINDFIGILMEFKPQIIHFSGHGNSDGSLNFINRNRQIDILPPSDLSKLLSIENTRTKIYCVVLNACYSEILASEIIKYVDYVIGVSGEVEDEYAMKFAVQFYECLGNGYGVEEAFDLAGLEMRYAIRHIQSPFIIKKHRIDKN